MSTRSLRVALFVNSFLPSIGGREVVVHHLAKALNALGHQCAVIGPGGRRAHAALDFGYPVHRFARLPLLTPDQSEALWLRHYLWRNPTDVIHAHNTWSTGHVANRLSGSARKPLVITPHGEDIHKIPEIKHGLRLNPEMDKKIRWAVAGADALTAISDSVSESLLDAGAEQRKIELIPNGIDDTRFERPIALNPRETYAIPEQAQLILTVGNYVPRRGHEHLVKSMPAIIAKHPRAHLVIVGRGTEVLKPLIDELGLADKVTLTGQVKPVELTQQDVVGAFYQTASCYVSAGMAEGSEGLSLALLDAMAAQAPIVATDISGNRDVVFDGKTGVVVRPGDVAALSAGIDAVLSSPEAAAERVAQAAALAKSYTWRAVAARYAELYQRVIDAA